jgi:hypothetical protein
MNVSDAFPSKYLKKEDFPAPRQVIIDTVTMDNVAPADKPPEMKLVMYFTGAPKPMIVNKTVAMVLGAMLGNETNNWSGKTVEVFNDVTVVFNGAVGGIRIRPVGGAAYVPATGNPVGHPSVVHDDMPPTEGVPGVDAPW